MSSTSTAFAPSGNVTSAYPGTDDVTPCSNEYCVSDEDYLDMIETYVFPTNLEWALIAVYVLVFVAGLTGNLLVCVAVWRNRYMRTVTNLFIVNLSVADILVIVVCLPLTVLGDVTETWYLGTLMCKIFNFIQGVSVSVSVFTLSVIAIERWYAICYPLKRLGAGSGSCYGSGSRARTRMAIIGIWLVSMVITIPELVSLEAHHKFPELTVLLTTCRSTWKKETRATYQILQSMIMFFFPSCLVGFCYCRIAKTLWRNNMPVDIENEGRSLDSSKHKAKNSQILLRKKTAKMLIAVFVIFEICYFPVHLLNFLRYTPVSNSIPDQVNLIFALVAHWLCYFNSAINPIIYNFMSEKFRRAFEKMINCCSKEDSMACPGAHAHANTRHAHTCDSAHRFTSARRLSPQQGNSTIRVYV